MPNNFLTQHGLKVRLDLSYFMRMITRENKDYNNSVIIANTFIKEYCNYCEQKEV